MAKVRETNRLRILVAPQFFDQPVVKLWIAAGHVVEFHQLVFPNPADYDMILYPNAYRCTEEMFQAVEAAPKAGKVSVVRYPYAEAALVAAKLNKKERTK